MDRKFLTGGSAYIAEQIDSALRAGKREAVITGNYRIESAVRIPSDFTLIFDNCHLSMADGVYDNMFVNEKHGTDPAGVADGNIRIIGRNGAVLDGGSYNGLSERNALKNGMPPIWKNNLVLFTNVNGFEISGISCRNQRWWALNFIYCSNGSLHDIDFCACDIWMDADGAAHHGLQRDKYEEILIKNADGIDIRRGCHDIRIENITGFTEDDSVALTGLYGRLEQHFHVPGACPDIYNISVRNIRTAAFCTNVRLLNQGGAKMYNIEVDGVYDMSADSPRMDRGIYGVRIGDTRQYGKSHTAEDTCAITVRNVYSRGAIAAVGLAGYMQDVKLENICCAEGTPEFEDSRF